MSRDFAGTFAEKQPGLTGRLSDGQAEDVAGLVAFQLRENPAFQQKVVQFYVETLADQKTLPDALVHALLQDPEHATRVAVDTGQYLLGNEDFIDILASEIAFRHLLGSQEDQDGDGAPDDMESREEKVFHLVIAVLGNYARRKVCSWWNRMAAHSWRWFIIPALVLVLAIAAVAAYKSFGFVTSLLGAGLSKQDVVRHCKPDLTCGAKSFLQSTHAVQFAQFAYISIVFVNVSCMPDKMSLRTLCPLNGDDNDMSNRQVVRANLLSLLHKNQRQRIASREKKWCKLQTCRNAEWLAVCCLTSHGNG
ncbi:unnamed protein product [Amoebophrya sp. A120]|nr:unnamed protein product [Amoebophrya sp. A120]|eukprot:GSA120T00024256001.1